MNKKERAKKEAMAECLYDWSQQPGESSAEHSLFIEYLNFGKTRNYQKVTNVCKMGYSKVCDIANRNQWKLRSGEYDLSRDREMMMQLDEEVLKSKLRQQIIAKKMQKLAQKGVEMLLDNPEDLSAGDCARLLDVASKVENLALGSNTEITESKVEGKVAVQFEEIDPEIAKKIGKEIAMAASQEMEINV